MSVAVTTGPRSSSAPSGPPGVPFGRLVRAELRKLTDTRAGRWLLAAILAITPVVVTTTVIVSSPRNLTFTHLVNYTQSPQKILLPVLGILTVTSEWSQRTGLVTFTLSPGRGRVMLAKAVATLSAGLVSFCCALAAAAAGNALGAVLRHGNGSWAFGLGSLRDLVLVQVTGLVQGMAFGTLLLISAAAIVLYYVLPNAWSALFALVPGLKTAAPWVDLDKAQAPLYEHQTTARSWAQFLVATAIWVATPLVLGVIRVRRSEVKSG